MHRQFVMHGRTAEELQRQVLADACLYSPDRTALSRESLIVEARTDTRQEGSHAVRGQRFDFGPFTALL